MKITLLLLAVLFLAPHASAQQAPASPQTANKPDREQWFMDLGLGMFIHWSVDVSLGAVISHSMVGASDDYLQRFTAELPKHFNPVRFNPDEWADLAKLAGMKYVVFTAKHHAGFCMWDTKTTPFNVMNTPFKRDILKEVIAAFRKQGIAIGVYFSPEDFNYFHEHNIPVGRRQDPQQDPSNNPQLMAFDKAQLDEILKNYGPIDILFFDGPADGLKEYAWALQPNVVVTRGQMKTPEQRLPDEALPGPWEACFTMGTDWQYKPTNDPQKSGTELINMVIETRAKGGNLLLNVGPKPDGEIQIEQQALLRELALWNFVSGESIHAVRPCPIVKEGNVWFTQSAADPQTVYAFIPGGNEWKYGARKEITFKSLSALPDVKASILGYASQLVEYKTDFDASITVKQTPDGLTISAVNGQRLYTNNKWPNPIVLKLENVKMNVPAEQASNKKPNDPTPPNHIDGAQ